MKNYRFGMDAYEVNDANMNDFLVDQRNSDGSSKKNEHNPYGDAYVNDPTKMVNAGEYSITSIPSPYARMHLTDIAFRELSAGKGVLSENEWNERIENLSGDYKRAMSHCLDFFEMMYHFSELDLREKGITIKLINMVRPEKVGANKRNLRSFVDTLEIFRSRYRSDIAEKNVENYKFDFTKMYVFKHNGKTFGATSPFTGFFAKADCDLRDQKTKEAYITYNGHKMFTANPADWQGIRERSHEFIKFLYVIMKGDLEKIFVHLWAAIKNCSGIKLDDYKDLDRVEEYPVFNFGPLKLPKISGGRNESYIRPDGLDKLYLKYLLFLENPVDFSISKEAYEVKEIGDRVFPDGTNNKVPWMAVNDLLAESLLVLPYDINDNYHAVDYYDENNNAHRRCLLPIKREALDYLSIDRVAESLKVKKYNNGHFAVTLILPTEGGGNVELRRDYYKVEETEYPNGVLIYGPITQNFAFGIYPFVKSKKFDNIYKVLFYNGFEDSFKLDFYYFNEDRKAIKYVDRNVERNFTNNADNEEFPVNCNYYQVYDEATINDEKAHIDFIELTVELIKNRGEGNQCSLTGTAIIAPILKDVSKLNPGKTTIAVDLGTSNTFIAYQRDGEESHREINTIHKEGEVSWNELTLLNKECTKHDFDRAIEENRNDLYLRQAENQTPSDECLAAQLCEFIPTRIVASNEEKVAGYKFPIPTIVNNMLVNGVQDAERTSRISLVHSSIPFAYYKVGKRPNSEVHKYDFMAEGEFKWFYLRNRQGRFDFNNERKANFNAFLDELLFIVRSHMLCNRYNLDDCRLIWTFPLSFEPQLLRYYKDAWEKSFAKYFAPSFINTNGDISNKKEFEKYVMYTNESRSPIFECIDNPAEINLLTILMDVGGGSTDIIGYKQYKPRFISSFGFAGNALYLTGSMNSVEGKELKRKDNYMHRYVQHSCQQVLNSEPIMSHSKKIDSNESISTLMNYGLTMASTDFESIFDNDDVQFMLQFHNAALIYHTAQLCYHYSPDEMPYKVYLTGNGSKLFNLNTKEESLTKKIFEKVYANSKIECKISISSPDNPKSATAVGSLKGLERNEDMFNDNANANRVVMLGDSNTVFELEPNQGNAPVSGDKKVLKEQVRQNVIAFIDIFYDVLGTHIPCISKEDMKECLSLIKDDNKLEIGESLSDSVFFRFISLIMEQLSIKICMKM